MKKKTSPARIVVTRTSEINELLQELWTLSPELKEKISLTVHQAIVALVREKRRYQALATESLSLSRRETETAMSEAVDRLEVFMAEEATPRMRESGPHPDSIWND